MQKRSFLSLPLLALALWGAAVPASAADAVRVGSKIDTEGALLGQLIIQTLEAKGIKTTSRLSLGNTQVVRRAITSGDIDIYPEYTGNGAFFFNDEKNPVWNDAAKGYAQVKALDLKKNKLAWLPPAPANNTWSIAIRKDVAQKAKLVTMADLGRYIQQGGTFKLAASAEFIERPDALPAFQKTYGFTLKPAQLLALAGGDTAVTIKSAAENTSGVNAAMAYGTDGAVAALGLVTLTDNKAVQPIYAPAPLVRADVLARHPAIATALAPVFAGLNSQTLQQLNARIAVQGQSARRVAAAYLKTKGIIQ